MTFPRLETCFQSNCQNLHLRQFLTDIYCSMECRTAGHRDDHENELHAVAERKRARKGEAMPICKVCKAKFTTNVAAEFCSKNCTDVYYETLGVAAGVLKPDGEHRQKPKGGVTCCLRHNRKGCPVCR